MDNRVLIRWQAKEYEFRPKEGVWYWTVGIVAGGVAVSAIILGNVLFGLIAILGGFTLMLIGSRRPARHTYSLTERGLLISEHLIPYAQMTRFAIAEEEPRKLSVETKTLAGTLSAPLGGADYRAIRMELKNRDIEEVEVLDSFVERVASGMGL